MEGAYSIVFPQCAHWSLSFRTVLWLTFVFFKVHLNYFNLILNIKLIFYFRILSYIFGNISYIFYVQTRVIYTIRGILVEVLFQQMTCELVIFHYPFFIIPISPSGCHLQPPANLLYTLYVDQLTSFSPYLNTTFPHQHTTELSWQLPPSNGSQFQ